MSTEIATIHNELAIVDQEPVNPVVIKRQIDAIKAAMSSCMDVDIHYGTIPGTPKPSLYKPGAEVITLMFRMVPAFDESARDLGGGHWEFVTKCRLLTAEGRLLGEGIGSCSTMESKYRYRLEEAKCPLCGVPAIKKSKFAPKGRPKSAAPGWYCYAKIGGCGEEFDADDSRIVEARQGAGKIDNPDIADVYNTCRKMAKKRAHVDAVLTRTGASALFTQDLEDMEEAAQMFKQEHAAAQAAKPTNGTNGTGATTQTVTLDTLPEPLSQPWLYKLQGESESQGKELCRLATAALKKVLQPRFASKLTLEDRSNILAALKQEDQKQEAIRFLSEMEEGERQRDGEEDDIPEAYK